MSELFPNRRYVIKQGDGDTAVFHEPAEADAHARKLSKELPKAIVRVEVIEEAEPVGGMIFQNGRLLTTERDSR